MPEKSTFVWARPGSNFRVLPQLCTPLENSKPKLLMREPRFSDLHKPSAQVQANLKTFLQKHPQTFDGPLVGSELGLEDWLVEGKIRRTIPLHAGSYLDYLATDRQYGNSLMSSEGFTAQPPQPLFRGIGVTALVITSDWHMVSVQQLPANDEVTGELGPAGSGSLEPTDIESDNDLVQTMINGAFRETEQESGIHTANLKNSTILGLAEWKEKGFKPEFFMMASTHLTSNEILPHPVLADNERAFSGTVRCYPLTKSDQWVPGEVKSMLPTIDAESLTAPFEISLYLLALKLSGLVQPKA